MPLPSPVYLSLVARPSARASSAASGRMMVARATASNNGDATYQFGLPSDFLSDLPSTSFQPKSYPARIFAARSPSRSQPKSVNSTRISTMGRSHVPGAHSRCQEVEQVRRVIVRPPSGAGGLRRGLVPATRGWLERRHREPGNGSTASVAS
jgi:hypothetical protein